MVTVQKIKKDHWVASIQKPAISGEGKGPLGAVHDLFHRLHERNLVVVETPSKTAEGPRAEQK